MAPAGNGPSAGGPATARASRRPTWSGRRHDAEAGAVDLGRGQLELRPGPQRVVGHPGRARRDLLGVGVAEIDHEDHVRPPRAFVLAHHHRADARGRRPVDRSDRITVEVLAHTARELVATVGEMRELRRCLRVAHHDRTARGFTARAHVDGRRQVDRDPAPPAGEAERRSGDHLDADPAQHAAPGRGHDQRTAGGRVDPDPVRREREHLHLYVMGADRELDRERPSDRGIGRRDGRDAHPREHERRQHRPGEDDRDDAAQQDDVPTRARRAGDDEERETDQLQDDRGLGDDDRTRHGAGSGARGRNRVEHGLHEHALVGQPARVAEHEPVREHRDREPREVVGHHVGPLLEDRVGLRGVQERE